MAVDLCDNSYIFVWLTPTDLQITLVDVAVDVESVLAQAERLFASFSNFYYKLQYQIRQHLILKPYYVSQFRVFILEL